MSAQKAMRPVLVSGGIVVGIVGMLWRWWMERWKGRMRRLGGNVSYDRV